MLFRFKSAKTNAPDRLETLETVIQNGATKLMIAVHEERYTDVVDTLNNVKKFHIRPPCNVNEKDKIGQTALSIAAWKGNVKIVQAIISKGAEVNSVDKFGQTPLMLASHQGVAQVLDILLNHGAKAEERDNENWTALMFACRYGHFEAAKRLLAAGANPNVENNDNFTPLIYAAWFGFHLICETLLEKGANVRARNNYNEDSLHFAKEFGHAPAVTVLEKYESLAKIRDLQAIITEKDSKIAQLQQDLNILNGRMVAEVNRLTETIKDRDGTIKTLEVQIARLEGRLQESRELHVKEARTLKAIIAERDAAIVENKATIDSLEHQNDLLRSKLRGVEADLAASQRREERLQQDLKTEKEDHAADSRHLNTIINDLKEAHMFKEAALQKQIRLRQGKIDKMAGKASEITEDAQE